MLVPGRVLCTTLSPASILSSPSASSASRSAAGRLQGGGDTPASVSESSVSWSRSGQYKLSWCHPREFLLHSSEWFLWYSSDFYCIWVVIKRSDWLFWSLSDYFGLRVIIIEIRVEECHLCRAGLAWAPSPCGRVAPPPPCPAWRDSPPRGAAAPPTAAPCCRARRRRGAGSAPCPGPARAAPAARAAAGCWAGSAAAAGAPARRPCSGCTSGRKIFVWTWENISYWALPWAEPAGSSRKLTVGLGVRWGDLVASGTLKCTIYVIPCNVLIILTCKLECGVLCCVY